MKHFYRELRRKLRRDMTPSERIMWRHLRSSGLGVSFRRQHSIGPYIADFYCPSKKLAVEIDGDSHFVGEGMSRDRKRNAYFHEHGIGLLRFTNHDVRDSLEVVLEKLTIVLNENPPPNLPLKKGEGKTGTGTAEAQRGK